MVLQCLKFVDARTSRLSFRALLQVLLMSVALAAANVASAQSSTVELKWSTPAANAQISGRTQFTLTGRGFRTVRIYRNGQEIARASVRNPSLAVFTLDTTQYANGSFTLTAHAWSGFAAGPMTSGADAGARTF